MRAQANCNFLLLILRQLAKPRLRDYKQQNTSLLQQRGAFMLGFIVFLRITLSEDYAGEPPAVLALGEYSLPQQLAPQQRQ